MNSSAPPAKRKERKRFNVRCNSEEVRHFADRAGSNSLLWREWVILGKSLFCLRSYVASFSNVILSVSRRIPRKGTARLRHCSKKINQICEKLFLAHIYLFRFIALALRGRCFDCAVAPLNMTNKTWQCTNLCYKRAFYLHFLTYSPR